MEKIKNRTARSLIHRLTTATCPSSLSAALSEIRLLSKVDPSIRSPLADSGLVPVLTRLLLLNFNTQEKDDDQQQQQENALATLLNLSISSPSSLMSSPSLLPSLSSALTSPSPILAQHAAATLFSLLSVEPYRPIIGSKKTLILSPLISLLKSPNPPTRSLKDSLKALFAVALYPLNRSSLVELGIVPVLFSILVNYNGSGIAEDASAVVAQVAGCCEAVEAFREVGGVGLLVRMLVDGELGSGRARENAAAALLNLAMCGGERAVGDMREVEGAEEAVREVAETGSERARRKAEALLRVLESGRRRSLVLEEEEEEEEEEECGGGRYSDASLARSCSSSMGSMSL